MVTNGHRLLNRNDTIFYTKLFELNNNITGTGNILKDVVYRQICISLNCASGCCIGNINSMTCGLTNDCLKYADYLKKLTIVLSLFLPLALIFIVALTLSCEGKKTIRQITVNAFYLFAKIIFFPVPLSVLLIRCIRAKRFHAEEK